MVIMNSILSAIIAYTIFIVAVFYNYLEPIDVVFFYWLESAIAAGYMITTVLMHSLINIRKMPSEYKEKLRFLAASLGAFFVIFVWVLFSHIPFDIEPIFTRAPDYFVYVTCAYLAINGIHWLIQLFTLGLNKSTYKIIDLSSHSNNNLSLVFFYIIFIFLLYIVSITYYDKSILTDNNLYLGAALLLGRFYHDFSIIFGLEKRAPRKIIISKPSLTIKRGSYIEPTFSIDVLTDQNRSKKKY